MMQRNVAVTREINNLRNQEWLAAVFDACRDEDGGGLEQVTTFFRWRGGERDKSFKTYKTARKEFIQLYDDCDVSVLPTIKNVYKPPELMNMRELIKYATELRTVVDPFDLVTPEEEEKLIEFCENEEDLDVKTDMLQILFSWERIVMTEPLPEHLEVITPEMFKCLSPATKLLITIRSGLEPQGVTKGSATKAKKKISGSVAVEVTDDLPLNFVPESWSEIQPAEGLSFLPEKGRHRSSFPACLTKNIKGTTRKKIYPVVEPEYSDKFGVAYAILLTLNRKDRPTWDLNDGTTVLVSVVVTGLTMKEVMKGQPGETFIKCLEVTETKFPNVSHKVTLHELQKAVSVRSKAQAFDSNQKDQKSVLFQISGDKNSNRYNLDDRNDPQWPEFAVRRQSGNAKKLVSAQRSITPESSDSEEDEKDEADRSKERGQGEREDDCHWFKPVRTPRGRSPLGALDANAGISPCTKILTTMGVEKKILERSEVEKLAALAKMVRNAASNSSVEAPPQKQAPMKVLGENGGAMVNPLGGEPYTIETPVELKMKYAVQVGYSSEAEKGSNNFCITCNSSVFAKHCENFSVEKLKNSLAPGEGSFSFDDELTKQLIFAQPDTLFCPTCSPEEDSDALPALLMPGPDSMFPCPRNGCQELIIVGDGQIGLRCPSCALLFGLKQKGVKVKELNLHSESTKTSPAMQLRQLVAYLYETGGKLHHQRLKNPEAIRKLLAKAAVSHGSIPGLPRLKITTRIVAYFVNQSFSLNGKGGLCLEDFQEVCGEIPEDTGHWQEVLTAATGKLSKEDEKPPHWGFSSDASPNVKTAVIQAAANNCFELYAFLFGPNYKKDMAQAMTAYQHTVYKAGYEASFPVPRKLCLLMAIFLDYSSRVLKQVDDWSLDQRFDHEKIKQPGCQNKIRLHLFLNSQHVLKHVYAPYSREREKSIATKAFSSLDNCLDNREVSGLKAKGNPEAKVKADEAEKGKISGSEVDKTVIPKPLPKAEEPISISELRKQLQVMEKQKQAAEKETEKLEKQKQAAEKETEKLKKEDVERKAKAREDKKKRKAMEKEKKGVQDLKSGGATKRDNAENNNVISITAGVFHSQYTEQLPESLSQIAQMCPRNLAGQHICPSFNTCKGCSRPNEVPCPYAHEVIPVACFDLHIQQFLLINGGHKSLNGEMNRTELLSLIDEEQQERFKDLSEPLKINALESILHDKLVTMQLPVGEHISLKAINEGQGVQWLTVWGPNAPFAFSLNGVLVRGVYCVKLGSKLHNGMKLVLSGHVFDVGEKIALPGGGYVSNACFIMSLAASLEAHRKWPQIRGMQSEYLLLRDLVEQWASIPLEKLLQLPNSKFTSVYMEISKFEDEGLPDSFLMLVDAAKIQSLQGVHVAIISQSDANAAEFTIRLFLDGSSKLHKPFLGTRNTAKLLTDWTVEGERKALFHSFPVVCIASLMVGDPRERHAHPFSIRYTLKEFLHFMRRAHLATAAKISIAKCGMAKHLETELENSSVSEDSIRSAYIAVQQLREKVFQGALPNLEDLRLSKHSLQKAKQVQKVQQTNLVEENVSSLNTIGVLGHSLTGSKSSLHEVVGVVQKKTSKDQKNNLVAVAEDQIKVGMIADVEEEVTDAEEGVHHCVNCNKLWVRKSGELKKLNLCYDCSWVGSVVTQIDTQIDLKAKGKGQRNLQQHSQEEKRKKYDEFLADLKTRKTAVATSLENTKSDQEIFLAPFKDMEHEPLSDLETRKTVVATSLGNTKSDQEIFLAPFKDMELEADHTFIGCTTLLCGRPPREASEELRKETLKANLADWIKSNRGCMFKDTQQWAGYYDSKFIQLSASPEEFSEEERLRISQQLGKFMNEWYYFEVEKLSNDSEPTNTQLRMALLSIVDGLRRVWFRKRLNAGPEWASIYGEFKGKVSGEHLELLRSLVEEGGDALFMGPVKGYMAKSSKNLSTEEEGVALKEFARLLFAKKAIVFDYSDPLILERLIAAGVRMGSIVVAEKKTAAGILTGKFRVCNDSTDLKHTHAANSGIDSQAHSHQKTTNSAAVVLAALGEQREHKDAHLRAGKVDIADAFPRIPQPLGLIGCFASHLKGATIVLLNLEIVFGSKSSPGLFEVMGDLIIKALNMTPKVNPKFSGDKHPRSRRFVDDIFYSVAMSGSRYEEHRASILRLLRAMLGEDAVNLEKQGREGEAENYKYAFGCGIDFQRQEVWAPGAKMKKAYDLCQKFLDREEKHLNVGTVQQVSGVLQAVIGFAVPSFKKVVLPRLYAIISNATKANPDLNKLPQGMVAAPCLRDEVNEDLAWEQLRFNLRLFFGLASINDGALMCTSFEGCLPLQQRLTFPGNETEKQHISMVSDASGSKIFIQNLTTGEYILEELTEEELKVFNSWDTQDKTVQVTINHLENLPCLWAAVMFWGNHPGCIIRQFLDNVAAEYLQLDGRIKSAKDEQVGAVIAIIELMLQIRGYGERVTSKDNVADYFTRDELDADAKNYLREFEIRTGIKPKKVELPSWLRNMQWVAGADASSKAWYRIALKVLDHLEEKFSKELSRYCKVPIEMIRTQFERALQDIPPDPIPDFVQDFPLIEGPSSERQQLISPPRPTLTTLRRQAEAQGEEKWLKERGYSAASNLHEAIVAELNKKFQQDRKILERINPFYDPEYIAPLPGSLKWDPERLAKVAGVPVRQEESIGMWDFFSGQGGFGKAFRDLTNESPLFFVDHDKTAQEHLRDHFPLAGIQSSMEEAMKSMGQTLGKVGICTFSLPCIPFSEANTAAKGMGDVMFAPNLENVIKVISTIQPLGFLVECAPGICKFYGEAPSAVDVMKAKLGNYYHILVDTVNVEELVSSISGFQGLSVKRSALVRGYLKAVFAQKPEGSFGQEKHARLTCCTSALDLEGKETFAYSQMPIVDQVDFAFSFEANKGIAKVGNIHSPLKSNQAGFPNNAFCPRLGLLPTCTSSGRGQWMQNRCPSQRLGYEEQWEPSFRRLTATEVARAIGMRGFDSKKWNDFLGTNGEDAWRMVGNMPAQSFFDEAMKEMLVSFFKIGKEEDYTAFEKWKSKNHSEKDKPLKAKGKQRAGETERKRWVTGSMDAEVSREIDKTIVKTFISRKRKSPQLSEEDIQHIDAFAEEVRTAGKRDNTAKNYHSDEEHWKQYFLARNWDPLMKEDNYAEKCKKVISYIAYERVTFKLLARSIKRKLSGVAWYFVKNYQRNPLHDLEAAQVFLRDLSSKDPPPDPKIPATPQLVELVCAMIDQSSIGGAAVAACICLMFWIMMRSVEVLKPDIGQIDRERVVTWGDLTMRRSLNYEEEECRDEEFQEGMVMTVKIVSYKNDKIVATRTIEQNDKSPTCPVKAIKWLHTVLKAKGISVQANRPVCQLEGKEQFISRTQISELLKVVAIKCGCNPNKFASHSLRRGGASAYAAAGVPDEDIKRFGRWLSDAYKLYVMLNDTSILSKGHMNPAFVVPRYEKN